jgi:hypothetical protein
MRAGSTESHHSASPQSSIPSHRAPRNSRLTRHKVHHPPPPSIILFPLLVIITISAFRATPHPHHLKTVVHQPPAHYCVPTSVLLDRVNQGKRANQRSSDSSNYGCQTQNLRPIHLLPNRESFSVALHRAHLK